MLIVIVSVLINKDVFDPSYNDLKLMIWNCNYFCTKLIPSEVKVPQSCPTLWSHGLYSPWNSPGQNIEVGSLSLLQRIFPTQGSNPGLSHCRQIIYQVHGVFHTRILEWVAFSLLQCIFPTQESNRGLLYCMWILYQMSYVFLQGSILEWVAFPFSRGFSQARDRT